MVWVWFALSIIVVLIAGTKSARYADLIAERTGLGRIWIGLLLLAVMTSMPELVTGISSVALLTDSVTGRVGVPDLGLGTLLGSCIFNITIVVVLDVMSRREPVLNRVSTRQMASAGAGVLLAAIIGGTVLGGGSWAQLALGWVGIPSMIVFVLYLTGAWGLFRLERSRHATAEPPTEGVAAPLGRVWVKFGIAAVTVIGAGIGLSYIGDEIATQTGLDASFVGSLLLAVSTSMPELVVALSALRLGSADLALADILGANILDMSYVFILDLFYRQGSILAFVSRDHVITAAVIAGMSLTIILALRFRQRRKLLGVANWYSAVLLGLYIYGAYALFSSGTGG